MKALSFILSGKFAHFKKPDVNEYAYFTYNNIPKPTLLGLLGAIIGLSGYTQNYQNNFGKKDKTLFNSNEPEFYAKLKNLEICIIPLAKHGRFSKKIQIFNNSVGYANDDGGILNIREQWLENPKWQIMIKDDESDEFKKISEFLLEKRAIFIPYLGKNDHFADISEVCEIELAQSFDNISSIKSLFLLKNTNGENMLPDLDLEEENFLFEEFYPISFDENLFYKLEKICFTNQICELKNGKWFEYDDGVICFM